MPDTEMNKWTQQSPCLQGNIIKHGVGRAEGGGGVSVRNIHIHYIQILVYYNFLRK